MMHCIGTAAFPAIVGVYLPVGGCQVSPGYPGMGCTAHDNSRGCFLPLALQGDEVLQSLEEIVAYRCVARKSACGGGGQR